MKPTPTYLQPPNDKILVTVNSLVFSLRDDGLQVLLVRASPGGACWSIPGVSIPPDLSLEETAGRELNRLLGCHEFYLEQLYTYGGPPQETTGRLISVVYFALVPACMPAVPINKDDAEVQWFPVDRLPETVMDHAEIITYGLKRVRYKLEYSAVGFQLLPEEFTLTELQRTYEMILGEILDKRNFRRRILEAGVIEPTERYRPGEGRPARLYRYRPDAVAEVKTRRLFP